MSITRTGTAEEITSEEPVTKVYGYHIGCPHEGCWLVSIHATRGGAQSAMRAAHAKEQAESDAWLAEIGQEPDQRWARQEENGKELWKHQRKKGYGDDADEFVDGGGDIAYIEEHDLLP